jgi:hypothetical protein
MTQNRKKRIHYPLFCVILRVLRATKLFRDDFGGAGLGGAFALIFV